jgi:hypothetical protein
MSAASVGGSLSTFENKVLKFFPDVVFGTYSNEPSHYGEVLALIFESPLFKNLTLLKDDTNN